MNGQLLGAKEKKSMENHSNNEENPILNWINSDKELSNILLEIQNLNISINEQVEIAFHRISDFYGLPKMPEDVQNEDDDTNNEEFEQTSVYEQFGLLKYLHNDDEDLRGVLLSAIYFTKNGHVADIDEVYKKYYSKNKSPIVGVGFKNINSSVELVFVKKGESWFDLGCKMFIKNQYFNSNHSVIFLNSYLDYSLFYDTNHINYYHEKKYYIIMLLYSNYSKFTNQSYYSQKWKDNFSQKRSYYR